MGRGCYKRTRVNKYGIFFGGFLMVHPPEERGDKWRKIDEQVVGLLEQTNCWYAKPPYKRKGSISIF
jgi:hypothetical protein